MSYSTINRSKWGVCSICGGEEQEVVKVKKDLFCLYHRGVQKAEEQQKKALARNAARYAGAKVRSFVTENPDVKPPKDYAELDRWFKDTRKKLTGKCQCGCNKPSSKFDDRYYKHSCSHVFPKAKFASVKTHPRNFVERAFWGGCHSVMDDTSMDRWVTFADWENIKEIFHELAPLLTDEERATKFYAHFEKLIYQ